MGYDPNICNSQLTSHGMIPCGGGVQNPHCVDFNSTPEHAAQCPDPNSPDVYKPISSIECYSPVLNQTYYTTISNIASDCGKKMAAEPQNQWTFRQCDCCCSCFAYGTPIATPDGLRAVETFAKGDQILVASKAANGALTWGVDQVEFSSGTGPNSSQGGMVHLRFGGDKLLVSTADQVFMLEGGKLVQAGRVIPGTDRLMLADGSSADIDEARIGTYGNGVHHIATTLRWDDTIDGHLLNANGVVGGDYLLQLHIGSLPAGDLVDGHWDRPIIGSDEYKQAHETPERQTSAFHARVLKGGAPMAAAAMATGFKPFLGRTREMPDDAGAFFTDEQESDLISNSAAVKVPLTETMAYGLTVRLFKQINAFFPDVLFYVAWDDIHINAYAFREYGRSIVYVSGGLLRLQALSVEGTAIVLLQQAGYFEAESAKNGQTLATKGEADYWAVFMGSRAIYMPNSWFDVTFKGVQQLQTIFGFISKDSAAGDGGDDGVSPALDCRFQTFMAGMAGGSLPPCAGGISAAALEVESASASSSGVDVTFSTAVAVDGAQTPGNYTLSPAARVTKATLDPRNALAVALAVALEPGTAYTLTVAGVTSVEGGALDAAGSTASFKTPAAAPAAGGKG